MGKSGLHGEPVPHVNNMTAPCFPHVNRGVWDPRFPLSPPWKTPVDRFAPELQLLSRLGALSVISCL